MYFIGLFLFLKQIYYVMYMQRYFTRNVFDWWYIQVLFLNMLLLYQCLLYISVQTGFYVHTPFLHSVAWGKDREYLKKNIYMLSNHSPAHLTCPNHDIMVFWPRTGATMGLKSVVIIKTFYLVSPLHLLQPCYVSFVPPSLT